MKKLIRLGLLSSLFVAPLATLAQAPAERHIPLEVGLLYSGLRINAPAGSCGCYWMQGGRVEFHAPLWGSVGIVGEAGGVHVNSINSVNEGLGLVTYLFGPRYTYKPHHRIAPFAQVLVGGVHGFDAYFPNQDGTNITPDALAVAAGGGVNVRLMSHVSLRLAQVDYLFTRLPNNEGDKQNSLRVGAGLIFRF